MHGDYPQSDQVRGGVVNISASERGEEGTFQSMKHGLGRYLRYACDSPAYHKSQSLRTVGTQSFHTD